MIIWQKPTREFLTDADCLPKWFNPTQVRLAEALAMSLWLLLIRTQEKMTYSTVMTVITPQTQTMLFQIYRMQKQTVRSMDSQNTKSLILQT